MHSPLSLVLALGMLPQALFAQTLLPQALLPEAGAPTCPADRPVDELITEINTQTKRSTRNKNPLPDDICIFGWCSRAKRPHSQKPELVKEVAAAKGKSAEANSPADPANTSSETKSAESSSDHSSALKSPEAKCDAAMEIALSAAHSVEVGDHYFEQKNYNAARLRYKDAVAEKPMDAAIHVRLGRALERLNDVGQAIEHYQRAAQLAGPAKWSEEAKSALQRLRPAGI